MKGYVEIATSLIGAGADISKSNPDGENALVTFMINISITQL
jgi:ankyrin repeat protein